MHPIWLWVGLIDIWDLHRSVRVNVMFVTSSLSAILQTLKPGMTKPEVLQCPDGHYCRVIYGLGPYIADYPEQVWLTGVVSGWCGWYVGCLYMPSHSSHFFRCTANAKDLDKGGIRQTC
jgi:hypothetical protein